MVATHRASVETGPGQRAMSGAAMHGNRATRSGRTCTAAVHDEHAHLAPFFVQHRGRLSGTAAVQLTLHDPDATQDNLPTELQIPSCTGVQEGTQTPYRICVRGDVNRGLPSNPLTARAWCEASL